VSFIALLPIDKRKATIKKRFTGPLIKDSNFFHRTSANLCMILNKSRKTELSAPLEIRFLISNYCTLCTVRGGAVTLMDSHERPLKLQR
jgi:hypothetical protein